MSEHAPIFPIPKATTSTVAETPLSNVFDDQAIEQRNSLLTIQPKLTIGSPDDLYEQEADSVANSIMRMPEMPFSVQRKCAACEQEEIQKKPLTITSFIQKRGEDGGGVASDAISNQIESSRGGGSPMGESTKSFMESRFGNDFSGVRIHTDANAVQLSQNLNAQAFTVGNDVFFNQGKYNPESDSGKHLLAHELTHTLQQGGGIERKIQRTMYNGNDEFGSFSLNDSTCAFNYNQTWFFDFRVELSDEEKNQLMENARTHVHSVWSNKFQLVPTPLVDLRSCPCTEGATVDVNIRTVNHRKTGRG
ncbi:MAG: DUF4157 domain-containing protein, partial [Leadbetterella sp.]